MRGHRASGTGVVRRTEGMVVPLGGFAKNVIGVIVEAFCRGVVILVGDGS